MHYSDMMFLNALAPYVCYDASLSGSSIFQHTPHAIYVNVPATTVFQNNPTKDLLDRLAELKKTYSTPWLPGSTIPTEIAFQNAKDFVSTLPLSYIPKPAIHVASDGEVNFHWAGPNFQIDLGFYGDGKFSYFGSKDGSQPIFGDDIPVQNGAPNQLIAIATAA